MPKKYRIFLYITSFLAGLSIMAIEIGASRLLAPFFSSSQIVWTIIIGVIMIAMALGNFLGGKMADKRPHPKHLYIRLIIAATWVALIPLVGKYVITGIALFFALFIKSNYLIISAFFACLLLFGFPLMLLGTTTPSLTRYTITRHEESGKVVGTISALNTVGSIIGTFTPTFITIPFLGTAGSFLLFAGILLLLSIAYFIMYYIDLKKEGGNQEPKKKVVKDAVTTSICLFLFIISSIFGTRGRVAFWDKTILYEGESLYNYLRVYEDDEGIHLSTHVLIGVQSTKFKTPGLRNHYHDYALLGNYFVEPSDGTFDILTLGLGTGTYPSQQKLYFNDAVDVTGVEIDGKIVELAYEFFDLPETVHTYVDDGRHFLVNGAGKEQKYDIIFCDAYQDITIPFHMATTEFFALAKNHLEPNGVIIINMNMFSDKPGSINNYLCDTAALHFSTRYSVGAAANKLFFASNNANMMELAIAQINNEPNPYIKNYMSDVLAQLEIYNPGNYILTDDKAPVELLGMRVIDDIIQAELEHYRQILREKGLKGLLEMLL
ncbi:MAG: spermidine synthase [Tenericutes bacterium ADurb.Bin087]|nr:MAG: spermidine synthase [Tenericutes bacterium ADurb.Bin087]